jgi:hypothetical protein
MKLQFNERPQTGIKRRNAAVLIRCKNNRNCEQNFHSATESFNLAPAPPSFAVTMSLSCEERSLLLGVSIPQSTEQCCHTPASLRGAGRGRKQYASDKESSDTLHAGFNAKGCKTENSSIVAIILRRINTRNMIWMKNCVFLDVTPGGSCKNRRFGGTERLLHQGDKNW